MAALPAPRPPAPLSPMDALMHSRELSGTSFSNAQVFVLNPNKEPPIVEVLQLNRHQLLKYLKHFQYDRGEDWMVVAESCKTRLGLDGALHCVGQCGQSRVPVWGAGAEAATGLGSGGERVLSILALSAQGSQQASRIHTKKCHVTMDSYLP